VRRRSPCDRGLTAKTLTLAWWCGVLERSHYWSTTVSGGDRVDPLTALMRSISAVLRVSHTRGYYRAARGFVPWVERDVTT
jgi:hypothetical protein